jgi:arylsulfatase A-like enzyme
MSYHPRDPALGLRAVALAVLAAGCGGEREAMPHEAEAAERAPRTAEPEPGPERDGDGSEDGRAPVFDLVANRILAHRFVRGAWVLVAGGGGFDKAIPWRRGLGFIQTTRADQPVALISGRSATLAIPERAGEVETIRVVAVADKADTLRISSLGERVGEIAIDPGWQEVEVRLVEPARARLSLTPRRARNVAIAALAAGAGELEPLGDPGPVTELGPGQSLSYYIYIPEGAALRGRASKGCGLAIAAVTDAGAAIEGALAAGQPPVELGDLGDQVARVDVSLAGCDRGSIEALELIAPVPPPVELGDGEPPANVLLWVMDTLRADRIKLFNPGARPEVPGMERLARRGVVFRRAWTQGNESQTSHASMWTSTYPATHGVRTAGNDQKFKLDRELPTLGQLLSATKKTIVGFTANGMVTEGGGYARGFDRFENIMRARGKGVNGWIPSNRLYAGAIEILEPLEAPHVFFYGTIDTHKPWVGHQPWLDRYDPGPYRGKFKDAAWPGDLGLKRGSMKCTDVPGRRDLQRINAIYDSALSFQDKYLDEMLTWLDERGRLDDTLIIVTSDHGEELWEVGRCGHGASQRETLLWVPLIVSYPKRLPSNLVIEEGVDTLDVLPTVLDLVGVDPPPTFQGASLVPLIEGRGRGYPRASYASQYEYAHAMRIGRYKLRVFRTEELYDLDADPGERANLAFKARIAHQHVGDALQLFLRNRTSWKKAAWGPANNLTAAGAAALERPR